MALASRVAGLGGFTGFRFETAGIFLDGFLEDVFMRAGLCTAFLPPLFLAWEAVFFGIAILSAEKRMAQYSGGLMDTPEI
jgi:hypothetical protein